MQPTPDIRLNDLIADRWTKQPQNDLVDLFDRQRLDRLLVPLDGHETRKRTIGLGRANLGWQRVDRASQLADEVESSIVLGWVDGFGRQRRWWRWQIVSRGFAHCDSCLDFAAQRILVLGSCLVLDTARVQGQSHMIQRA